MTADGLNWADYVIIGIVGISIIISALRGFVKEAISLIVWALAAFIAIRYSGLFTEYFNTWIASASLRYVVFFVILFVLVLLLGVFISVYVSSIINRSGLSVADRLLGMVFGAARGALLVGLLLMFVNVANAREEGWSRESHLVPYFEGLADWLHGFVPEKAHQVAEWAGRKTPKTHAPQIFRKKRRHNPDDVIVRDITEE